MEKQPVIAYIDGYNLYHGFGETHTDEHKRRKWLDLQKLCEGFLEDNEELVEVKYFTAKTITKKDGSKERQQNYWKALEACCPKLTKIEGKFKFRPERCRKCYRLYNKPEEKKTDVNIACAIIDDAYHNRYDLCYLISGDIDLAPPLEIIKEDPLNKQTKIFHPPENIPGDDLVDAVTGECRPISDEEFQQSQLPDKIPHPDGTVIKKPPKYYVDND